MNSTITELPRTRLISTSSEQYRIRESCFADLVLYVRVSFVEKGDITTVAKLSKFYKDMQLNKNVPVKEVAPKDIKLRL